MRLAPQRQPRALVNITPLIDVVFILLVFFMLAGAIERPETIEVTPPQSMSALLEGDPADIVILVSARGEIFFQDQPVRDTGELIRTATLWFATLPNSSIQLKADAEVEATRVIEIMEGLREAGARYLVLVTIGGGG